MDYRSFHRSQSGYSLVGAVIAVALLIGFISLSLLSSSQLRILKQSFAASGAYQDVELIVRRNVANAIVNHMRGAQACNKSFIAVPRQLGSTGLTAEVTSQVPTISSKAPSQTKRAYSRCRQGRFRMPPGSQDFYFCVAIDGNRRDFPTSSPLRHLPGSFLEIYAYGIDFHTGERASCQDFRDIADGIAAGGGIGVQVFYSLYWRGDSKVKEDNKRKNGSFFIPAS